MGLKDFEVQANDNNISIIYRDLLFPPDSPEISPETNEKISKLGSVIERFSNMILIVEGHSAKIEGSADDGTELSFNRASAVTEALAETGLFTIDRMKAYGIGEYRPVAENGTEEGRIQNRRVEISITDHFVDDKTSAESDPAVWWKMLSDIEDPGYMVFLFDNDVTSEEEVSERLLENGYASYRVYDTEEGIALVYPDISFDESEVSPADESLRSIDSLLEILPVGDSTQVRIGGRGGFSTDEIPAEARYNTGLYIARETPIKPSNTLVGDEPYAYELGDDCSAYGSSKFFDSIDFSIVEANPLGRYREFSDLGIGAGFELRFAIPAFNTSEVLSPVRIGLGVNGLYHLQDDTSSVESLWEGEWGLSAGYKLYISKIFTFTPMLGYGGTVHILTNTTQSGLRQVGEAFYSQTMSVKTDLELAPEKWLLDSGTQLAIFIQPYYRVFFDQEYLGHSVNAKLGLRLDF